MADEIRRTLAFLELADAIVLTAEGDQASDGRVIAALNVAAEELASLRESDRVYRGSRAQDRVVQEGLADKINLLGDIAEEGGRAIIRRACRGDQVDVCAGVDFFEQACCVFQSVAIGGVA